MANRHVNAIYVTRPVSIAYLTGFEANPHERLMALAIRQQGATLIVPALEEEKALAALGGTEAKTRAADVDVLSWRDGESPWNLVRDAIGRLSEIGVEKDHLSLLGAETITTITGASELVDAGPELRRRRLTKTEDEIEKLQRAAAITDEAGERVIAHMRAGMSEVEVGLLMGSAIGELGGELSFPTLVQSGPNSSLPHWEPSSRKLAAGDLVLLDFGAAFGGYKADSTRMAVIGEPSAKQREIHALVLAGHDAAIEAVRAGVTTGEIDGAARRVIEDGGYGEQFFHRIGHGIGLEGHEDPSLDPGSKTVLEPGMTFTIEPGIYIPGWGGVRIEDDVVVEEGGCRVLTKADRSLRTIKG